MAQQICKYAARKTGFVYPVTICNRTATHKFLNCYGRTSYACGEHFREHAMPAGQRFDLRK